MAEPKICPGCGAAVESDHVAHFPPEVEPEETDPPPDPEAAEPVAVEPKSGFDFSTTLFDDED